MAGLGEEEDLGKDRQSETTGQSLDAAGLVTPCWGITG